MLKFGDVFLFEGVEYVFLAKLDGLVYAGQILQPDKAQRILFNQGKLGKKPDHILYCYVMLKTPEVKDKMAHFASAADGNANLRFDNLNCSLSPEDLAAIKNEIVTGPFPKILQETISAINLDWGWY